MCDLLETTCPVKPRGDFTGERLIVDKSVSVGGTDGLFIKVLSVEQAALYSCDLSRYQCSTVFEILLTVLCPYFELSMMSGESLEMLLPLVGRCGIPGCRVGEGTVEVILCRFEQRPR